MFSSVIPISTIIKSIKSGKARFYQGHNADLGLLYINIS